MEKFYLDTVDTGKFIRVFQLFFGGLCLTVAIAWLFLYPGSVKSGFSFWISFFFLAIFGIYLINSGIGRGRRFVGINEKKILFKSISLLPTRIINSDEISRIKIYPLNILFIMKNKRNMRVRLGTAYTDTIRPIKDAVANYAHGNKIPVEFEQEEI